MLPEIKICGITDPEDADYAVSNGATFIGVVLSELSPRRGSPAIVQELTLKGYRVAGVYTDFEAVMTKSSLEDYIQLHFPHGVDEIHFVHQKLGKKVISVVFPDDKNDILKDCFEKLGAGADLVLVDYGREINSTDVKKLQDLSGFKIGLAGKISTDNIREVLKANPYFVDLSSSLETSPGRKDRSKIENFMEVFKIAASTF